MDKKYMLQQIKYKLKVLEQEYSAACSNKTVDGKQLTINGAGTKRARVKQRIQVLILLQELLENTTITYIDNEDACDVFDKLVR